MLLATLPVVTSPKRAARSFVRFPLSIWTAHVCTECQELFGQVTAWAAIPIRAPAPEAPENTPAPPERPSSPLAADHTGSRLVETH